MVPLVSFLAVPVSAFIPPADTFPSFLPADCHKFLWISPFITKKHIIELMQGFDHNTSNSPGIQAE
jgi:hypothetical protein